jgi:hypothetical protein
VAAAIARFEAEVGVAPAETSPPVNPWQRAALIEGVSAKETVQDREGGARWLW